MKTRRAAVAARDLMASDQAKLVREKVEAKGAAECGAGPADGGRSADFARIRP